jgi:hypothetical protein
MAKLDRVAFRVWDWPYIGPIPNEVLAVLPDCEANPGHVMCYAHVGQHGEGDLFTIHAKTRVAEPKEYKSLLAELRQLGYKLRVVKRISVRR